MAGVNVGEFDSIVSLYSVVEGRGSKGQKTEEWKHEGDIYASVKPLVTEQAYDYNQEQREVLEVTCWKDARITTRWRIEYGDSLYDIVEIDPGNRIDLHMQITVRRVE